MKHRNYTRFEEATFVPINWIALLAWAIGVALAQFAPGITPLNALVGTAVVYTGLMKLPVTKAALRFEKIINESVEYMIIQNAALKGKKGLWQITIEDGMFTRIEPQLEVVEKINDVLNVNGSLVLPPFIEPHIHLDTTLTAGEPEWNQSGTLFEGIQRWSERKAFLTHEDVKTRAKKPCNGRLLKESSTYVHMWMLRIPI